MTIEAKDRSGLSRLGPREKFEGNHPIEKAMPYGEIDQSGVNFIAQMMRQSGKYEYVRTDQALDKNGKVIFGERAIIVLPRKKS